MWAGWQHHGYTAGHQPAPGSHPGGRRHQAPMVLETPQGDVIGIRHAMSMSYDHRVVDGMMGGSFLNRVAQLLEAIFDPNRDVW